MITRADVINNAGRYINISSWNPLRDTHVFDPANPDRTFHSAFRMVAGRQYDVVPYCYGGFDSITRFPTRINNRTCPGGWDRISSQGTKHWYDPPSEGGFDYAWHVPQNLAGIDCSGYVLRCWSFTSKRISGTWYVTGNLPNLCLKVNRGDLKPGDILNSKRLGHVRIFNELRGAQVNVYEAAGGGRPREFRPGDEFGRVVHHTIGWDGRYTPYSPFPQFTDQSPLAIVFQDPTPTISVKIAGCGDIGEICMSLDSNPVTYSPSSVYDSNHRRPCTEIRWVPNQSLTFGTHIVRVSATNRVLGKCFFDEYKWDFEII